MYPPQDIRTDILQIFTICPPLHLYNNHQRQCSARGHCPPAARLRRWRQGNVKRKTPDALVSTRDRRSIQVHTKKFSPKGAKYSTALFCYLFFLNRCTLKHKTPASKQPEFLFIAVFIFVHVPAFSAARTSAALRKPPRKTSLYPGSANMRQDHAPLQNPGNSPRADKPPNRQKNRNRRLP